MAHTVSVPLVIATRQDGSQVYVYQGAPLPLGLRAGEEERLVEQGLVKADAPEPEDETSAPERPAEAGPGSAKEKWLAYAAHHGIQVDPESSKEDIVAAVSAAGH